MRSETAPSQLVSHTSSSTSSSSMSCLETVYATQFPSAEICGSATSAILLTSEGAKGRFFGAASASAPRRASVANASSEVRMRGALSRERFVVNQVGAQNELRAGDDLARNVQH